MHETAGTSNPDPTPRTVGEMREARRLKITRVEGLKGAVLSEVQGQPRRGDIVLRSAEGYTVFPGFDGRMKQLADVALARDLEDLR